MDENNGVTVIDLPIEAVVYREDLYPRSQTEHHKVQEYAENLEVMPPIEVNQHYILIDGWHRWMAHKKEEKTTIRARMTETLSDVHIKQLAFKRNNHGVAISREDKQKHAREVYAATPLKEREAVKEKLCEYLSITARTLNTWLRRIDEDTEKERKDQARAGWLVIHKKSLPNNAE